MANITENNMSYCNKDFESIWNEALESVPKLTTKWDPASSNESDPGVVLLKEAAIIADKINYNNDKNILEAFPSTVSQLGNARELFASLGYTMSYYKSATGNITLLYTGDALTGTTNSITLPKFSTVFTNDDNSVSYVLLNDIIMSEKNVSYTGSVIEGTLLDFDISGSLDIKLDNLDNNNRLYFESTNIAENGIFISNIDEDGSDRDWEDWKRVTNLASHELDTRVFEFGILPNSGICYIEFPQDIANLIENGLHIKYIVSSGYNGNILPYVLTNFLSVNNITAVDMAGNETTISSTDISISNFNAITNGEDPESIEDAYKSYKRVKGTFDTLVTRRDYENAIYNLENSLGSNLISNVAVSDRTNDINSTVYIQTQDITGDYKVLQKSKTLNIDGQTVDKLSAFNIGIYALNAPKDLDYNKGFIPNKNRLEVEAAIEELKSIQHDYWYGSESLPYIFKNFCTIKGKIITTSKVTKLEAATIKINIRAALFAKYSSRKVNFGEAYDYSELAQTIEQADVRIKACILDEPIYELRYITNSLDIDDESAGTISASNTLSAGMINNIIARLILSGNVPLFAFDDEFDVDFGQTDINIANKIKSVNTKSPIYISQLNTSNFYTLRDNENLVLYKPKLVTTLQYGSYVGYKINFTIANPRAEVVYEVPYDGAIQIWTKGNPEGSNVSAPDVELKAGQYFKFSSGSIVVGSIGYIAAGSSLDILEIDKTELAFANSECTWVTNTVSDSGTTNVLFLEGQSTRVLGDGEVFIYTNPEKTEYVIFGSGTLLSRNTSINNDEIAMTSNTNLSSVIQIGSEAIGNTFRWSNKIYGKLEIINQEIITLPEHSQVKLNANIKTSKSNLISNLATSIQPAEGNNANFKYEIGEGDTPSRTASMTLLNTQDIADFSGSLITASRKIVDLSKFSITIKDGAASGQSDSTAPIVISCGAAEDETNSKYSLVVSNGTDSKVVGYLYVDYQPQNSEEPFYNAVIDFNAELPTDDASNTTTIYSTFANAANGVVITTDYYYTVDNDGIISNRGVSELKLPEQWSLIYKLPGNSAETTIYSSSIEALRYNIYSRLNLVGNPDLPQTLNTNSTEIGSIAFTIVDGIAKDVNSNNYMPQTIEFTYYKDTVDDVDTFTTLRVGTDSSGSPQVVSILYNDFIEQAGGDNVIISNYLGTTVEDRYPYSAYTYVSYTNSDSLRYNIVTVRNQLGFINCQYTTNALGYTLPYGFQPVGNKKYIIPIFKSGNLPCTIKMSKVELSDTLPLPKLTIKGKNVTKVDDTYTITSAGTYYIFIEALDSDDSSAELAALSGYTKVSGITIAYEETTKNTSGNTVLVGDISIATNYSSMLANLNIDEVLAEISDLDINNEFNWAYRVDDNHVISVESMVNSDGSINPLAFFDSNNFMSNFTIAQIDTSALSIEVASSSLK